VAYPGKFGRGTRPRPPSLMVRLHARSAFLIALAYVVIGVLR
jgi:hypothetical protein